jgi:hypothetical protein
LDDILVDDPDAARCDRPECEFRVRRHAEFADHYRVQRRVQRDRDFVGEWNAAAWQAEDYGVFELTPLHFRHESPAG